jgi:hypothetical protein
LAVFKPKNKVYALHKGEEDGVTGVGAAMGRLLRRTLVLHQFYSTLFAAPRFGGGTFGNSIHPKSSPVHVLSN